MAVQYAPSEDVPVGCSPFADRFLRPGQPLVYPQKQVLPAPPPYLWVVPAVSTPPMKTFLFALVLFTGAFPLLLAQKPKFPSQPYATPTTMNAAQQTQNELFQFMRNAFPGSRSVPDAGLRQSIDKAWQQGLHYGLSGGDELGTYVIAAYALGENFDRDIAEAAAVLQDPSYTGLEKTEWLEAFANDAVQALMQPENNPTDGEARATGVDAQVRAMLDEEATRQARGNAGDPNDPYHAYHEVQRASQPYRLLAQWAVDRLRHGDLAAVLKKFSATVLGEVGQSKAEAVFREKVVPFFQASLDVADSVEVGKVQLADGMEGYAFSMHLVALRKTKPFIGTKPFTLMVVAESGRLVIANVDVNQEDDQ